MLKKIESKKILKEFGVENTTGLTGNELDWKYLKMCF